MSKLFLAAVQKHHERLGRMLNPGTAEQNAGEIAAIRRGLKDIPKNSPLRRVMVNRLARLTGPKKNINVAKVRKIHAMTGNLLELIQTDPMYNRLRIRRKK